ncbi:MAG: tandem-95 repeat protein, partial [Verrucomicrobiales bacterium]|nr:tandem-95 repeat protein [Verrucomicrobiales bacterium]
MMLAIVAVFSSAQLARAVSFTLQGQDKGSSTWSGNQISGWGELELIPFRLDVTAGPVTNQVLTISFPRDNAGIPPIPGIQDLYNWSTSTNMLIASGPTLTTSTGSTWVYTLTITVTNNQEADLYFFARLAAGSHGYGGNSMKITASVGGAVGIFKPATGSGTPDLGITKT